MEIMTMTTSAGDPRNTLTAPTTLRLAAPAAMSACMATLGFIWEPHSLDESELTTEHGLYTWVDGPAGNHVDPLNRGVLYIGVGESAKGVLDRLKYEQRWADHEAEHAHGMAVFRRQAVPLVSTVRYEPADLSWLDDVSGQPAAIREWLHDSTVSPVAKAERLAIRLAIFIGDVGAPVQSTHAGAWANVSPAHYAAYAAAQRVMDLAEAA
jgi:hypothetical protein